MTRPRRRWELPLSLAAFAGSFVLNYFAGMRAERIGETAHSSPDLLLGHLPFVDLRWLYLWGYAAFIVVAVLSALRYERPRLAYLARVFAIVIAARAALMVLTPMRHPEGDLPVQGDILYDAVGRYLTMRNDLFFSSHTAIPFLASLVFRPLWLRRGFLAFSVLMAATVLLGRNHYSIDVAGAFLIPYALVRLERRWVEARLRV